MRMLIYHKLTFTYKYQAGAVVVLSSGCMFYVGKVDQIYRGRRQVITFPFRSAQLMRLLGKKIKYDLQYTLSLVVAY